MRDRRSDPLGELSAHEDAPIGHQPQREDVLVRAESGIERRVQQAGRFVIQDRDEGVARPARRGIGKIGEPEAEKAAGLRLGVAEQRDVHGLV